MLQEIEESCRVCLTCKRNLPRSAYCTDARHKYPHCKSCENKRLALYRAKKVNEQQELTGHFKECEACHKFIQSTRFATTGIAATLVCRPCAKLILHHREPHTMDTLPNGECWKCATYGKSDNCIK